MHFFECRNTTLIHVKKKNHKTQRKRFETKTHSSPKEQNGGKEGGSQSKNIQQEKKKRRVVGMEYNGRESTKKLK